MSTLHKCSGHGPTPQPLPVCSYADRCELPRDSKVLFLTTQYRDPHPQRSRQGGGRSWGGAGFQLPGCLVPVSWGGHIPGGQDHMDAACAIHTVLTVLCPQTERDVSVRQRAVDLLYAMCDRSNAQQIVAEMLSYLETADYSIREEIVSTAPCTACHTVSSVPVILLSVWVEHLQDARHRVSVCCEAQTSTGSSILLVLESGRSSWLEGGHGDWYQAGTFGSLVPSLWPICAQVVNLLQCPRRSRFPGVSKKEGVSRAYIPGPGLHPDSVCTSGGVGVWTPVTPEHGDGEDLKP